MDGLSKWCPGICEEPRSKCADCGNRVLIPVSDAVVFSHLAGEKTIGIPPLLLDGTCYFVWPILGSDPFGVCTNLRAANSAKAEWR